MSGNAIFFFFKDVNKHGPMRKRKVKSNIWITSERRQKMRKRDVFKKQAVKQNSHQAWNDYKKARNEVNASIREAELISLKIALIGIVVI